MDAQSEAFGSIEASLVWHSDGPGSVSWPFLAYCIMHKVASYVIPIDSKS